MLFAADIEGEAAMGATEDDFQGPDTGDMELLNTIACSSDSVEVMI